MLLAFFFPSFFSRLLWGTLAGVQGLIITLTSDVVVKRGGSAVAGHAVSVGVRKNTEYTKNACTHCPGIGSDRIDPMIIIIVIIHYSHYRHP